MKSMDDFYSDLLQIPEKNWVSLKNVRKIVIEFQICGLLLEVIGTTEHHLVRGTIAIFF